MKISRHIEILSDFRRADLPDSFNSFASSFSCEIRYRFHKRFFFSASRYRARFAREETPFLLSAPFVYLGFPSCAIESVLPVRVTSPYKPAILFLIIVPLLAYRFEITTHGRA